MAFSEFEHRISYSRQPKGWRGFLFRDITVSSRRFSAFQPPTCRSSIDPSFRR